MKRIHFFGYLLFFFSCTSGDKPSFQDWQKSLNLKQNKKAMAQVSKFHSQPLGIDTIYRSMQGPYELKKIKIEENNEELLWITGYSSRLIESQTKAPVSDAFMCHNNLNYANEEYLPWKLKTSGDNSRLFTLSEGQTNIQFPEGFGIPVPNRQEFEMVSQVLNHNFPIIDTSIQHEVQVQYRKGSESEGMKALYQQSVFITKQIAGPAGVYGLAESCVSHQHLDSNQIKGQQPNHTCEIAYPETGYNPYADNHGRKYTGHWKIPYGEESLKTDVSQMLDLSEDTRIHYIGVHLHPFAQSMSLWDKTTNELLYEAELVPQDSVLGFQHLAAYSSETGIPLYADHYYELQSSYACWDSLETHTAMAVMYLYLAE